MTFDEYQQQAMATAYYPQEYGIAYPALGLAGETGETVDLIKKTIRDRGGKIDAERRHEIALEAGDVLWYLAALARELGMTLDEIAALNIAKVTARAASRP